MSKRKIAESLNIRIRTGDFQHIEMVKYAEEEIEYQDETQLNERIDHLNKKINTQMKKSVEYLQEKYWGITNER